MSDTESESALELGSRLTASSLSPTLPGDAEPLKPVDTASEPRGNLLKKQSESRLVGLQREDSVVRFAGEVSPAKTETPSRRPSSGHVMNRQHSAFNAIVDGNIEEYEKRVEKRLQPGGYTMLHPASKFRLLWDIQMLVYVVYVSLLFPYYMGFNTEAKGGVAIFELMIDYLFMVDLVLNFRTGYIDRNGIVVLDGRRVFLHYLRTWFLLDFVSSAPLDLLLGPAFRNLNAAKLLKVGRLFKALKMLRIGKLAKLTQESGVTESLDEFMVSAPANALFNLLKVVGSCALLCHLMACFMALSGPGFLETYACADDDGGCHEGNANDWPTKRKYLASLYWAMSTMTTVGYGDVIPRSDEERAYAMVGMIVGGGFYGYVIGIISTLVAVSDANMRAYNEKMGVVNAWLEFNDLPREMRRKVRTYFKTFLSERSALDEQAILNDLDPGLRAELGQYLIPDAVRDSALFSGLPPTVLAKLSTLLRPVPAAVDDVLQVQGTHGVTMHVVVAGLVEVGRSAKLPARGDSVALESPKLAGAFWGRQASDLVSPGSPKGPTTTHFLSASDTFGELVVLGIEHTYSATATAREPTALYMIEQAQLYERFSAMPEVINKMRQHAIEAREERQTGRGEPAGEETGKEGAKKRYKHMRSSLVGGGGATLPTGFADTMLEALGDIQHRLEEIYDRLDGIEQAQADPRSEALAAEAALNASLNASVAAVLDRDRAKAARPPGDAQKGPAPRAGATPYASPDAGGRRIPLVRQLSDHRITDNSPEANANRRRLKRFEELLENRSPEPTRRAISAVDAEHWIAATNKSRDRKHAAQAPRSTPAAYRSLAPKDDAAAARPPFKKASSGSALGEHAAAEDRPGLARSESDPSPETAERTLGET